MAVHDAFTTSLPLEEIAAHAGPVDREARFPRESVDALAEAGALGSMVPAAFGGGGAGPVEFVDTVEQVARACASTAMVLVMHAVATQTLAAGTAPGEPDGPKHAALTAAGRGERLLTL